MQNFAIRRQRNGARLLHRGAKFFAANFPRPRSEAQTSMAVDTPGMRSGHAQQGMLDRRSGSILRLFHRLLNRTHGFVQIYDDAFARTPRFSHAVPAVTQSVFGNFRHQRAGLGAAYVNRGQKVFVLVRHSYCGASPLAIAGLGFAGLLACEEVLARTAAASVAADCFPVFPWVCTLGACALGNCAGPTFAFVLTLPLPLARTRVFRTRALRCPALATFPLDVGFGGAGFANGGPTVFAVSAGDGLGAAVIRVIRAAGFTPAAIALLAATPEIGACFAVPCKSGLTMICRS